MNSSQIERILEFVGASEARHFSANRYDGEWCLIVRVGVMVFNVSDGDFNDACKIIIANLQEACLWPTTRSFNPSLSAPASASPAGQTKPIPVVSADAVST
jgi:hypothetical protein